MRTFKYVILNECSKWINLFKEHLLNYVLNRLNVSIENVKGHDRHNIFT